MERLGHGVVEGQVHVEEAVDAATRGRAGEADQRVGAVAGAVGTGDVLRGQAVAFGIVGGDPDGQPLVDEGVEPARAPARRAGRGGYVVRPDRAGVLLGADAGIGDVVAVDVGRGAAADPVNILELAGKLCPGRDLQVEAVGHQARGVDVGDVDGPGARHRVGMVGIDHVREDGGRVRAGIIIRERAAEVRGDDVVVLLDVVIIGGQAEPGLRLHDHAAGEVVGMLRLEVRVADGVEREERRRGIGVRRAGGGLVHGQERGRERWRGDVAVVVSAGLGEARHAEALGVGAAQGDLRDRLDDDADLGREVVEALGVVVVAAGHVDGELLEERDAELEEGRSDLAASEGTERVDGAQVLRVRVERIVRRGTRVVERLVARLSADAERGHAAGQFEQPLREHQVERVFL